MAKVTIELRPCERRALQKAAYQERRRVADQAAYLVRLALQMQGVLIEPAQPQGTEHVEHDRTE
jgi:hypothetical protein